MQRQFCVTCHSTIRSTFPARSSEFLVVSSRKCRNVLTRATIFSKHILRQFCWAIAGLLSRKTSKKSAHVFSVTPRFPSIFWGLSSQQPLFFSSNGCAAVLYSLLCYNFIPALLSCYHWPRWMFIVIICADDTIPVAVADGELIASVVRSIGENYPVVAAQT